MGKLEQKVALVIGGSGGIGKATALALGREGAKIAVAARREAEGSAVAEEIVRGGGAAFCIPADINDEAQITRAVQKTVETFGRLDFAVNVPGITGQVTPLAECSNENWDQVIRTNLTAYFWCMRAEVRQMLTQGGGAIVNISSSIGRRSFAGLGAYGASKRALESLTETTALEYAKQGIRVNAIAPGSIVTETFLGFTNGGDPAIVKMMAETYHPMARVGQPEEVASAVVFLCGDAAFTTGTTLTVDGGWAIRT